MSTPAFVKSVVKTCLGIRKGDKVTIYTWRHMLDLAEAFTMECRRAGALTHTEIGTDEIFYDALLNLPLEYLKTTDPFGLALMDVATANIFISGPESPERMKQVSADRWSATFKAEKPFLDKFLERKIRSADIMLGHVTRQRAKTYGFDYDVWKETVNAALDVKYEDMQKLGKKLRYSLEKAKEVHITTPKGTDLTFNLQDRPVHVYDGIVDDEDIGKGALFVGLPSGSVSVAPAESSATGTFISDVPEPQYGLLIHDINWGFKDGKLTSFKGGKNVEAIKATWEKGTGDKDMIGTFTLGINPKAKTGFIQNPIVLGTVTIGVGENRELGGKNESDWGFRISATQPTVELDGKSIIKKGELTL